MTMALGKFGDAKARGALETVLSDFQQPVIFRVAAAECLGELGDRRARLILENTLLDDNAFLAGVAARSLGKIGDLDAAPALLDALDHAHEEALGDIVETLGILRYQPARPKIEALLESGDSALQLFAGEALGELRHPASVPALRKALLDPTPFVAAAAFRSLEAIDPGWAPAFPAWKDFQATFAEELNRSLADADQAKAGILQKLLKHLPRRDVAPPGFDFRESVRKAMQGEATDSMVQFNRNIRRSEKYAPCRLAGLCIA